LRVASAAVLAPIALAAVWFGGAWFYLLVLLAAGLMAMEWSRVSFGAVNPVYVGLIVLSVAAVALQMIHGGAWIGLGAAVCLALAAGIAGLRQGFGWSVVGAFYIVLPCFAMVWLREADEHGRTVVLWLMLSVWATDIGAYFAGRSIGGPKLAPRISPNKTWAGLAGGMAAAALVGAATAALTELASQQRLLLAGLATAVLAQAGDLSKSAWKRHFGVKDSGSLIPGHGGVIDRLDGLLFVALGAAMMALLNGGRLLPWE